MNATFAKQGEGIAKVQREATRLMCEAIEQKLEALLKDRAWQEGLTNGEQKGGKLDLELREEEQMKAQKGTQDALMPHWAAIGVRLQQLEERTDQRMVDHGQQQQAVAETVKVLQHNLDTQAQWLEERCDKRLHPPCVDIKLSTKTTISPRSPLFASTLCWCGTMVVAPPPSARTDSDQKVVRYEEECAIGQTAKDNDGGPGVN